MACAEALLLGDLLGEGLEVPVLLYGELAGGRTRAQLRLGGPAALDRRIATGQLTPDFGANQLHHTAGAVLVAARPPLVAFNVELAPPATLQTAQMVAAAIREGAPEGLRGVRAIGVWLEHRGTAQVSMNIEHHLSMPLAAVVEVIQQRAPIAEAELVGLAPEAALDGFPNEIPLRNRATIEDALG